MSELDAMQEAKKGIRSALAIGGILAVALGVLILVHPDKSAMVVAAILGVYAVIAGLSYIGIGFFSGEKSGWGRIGNILLGVLYIIAGVVFFTNLGLATTSLAVVFGIMIGAIWIVEGVTALTMAGSTMSTGWAIFYGIISIIAGFTLLFSPLYGAAILWWLLGISLVVLGIVQFVRSFTV